MPLNGEMALILRYFTEFGTGFYFALFHRIRVRCRRKTIVTLTSVSKSTFDSLLIPFAQLFSDYLDKTNSDNSVLWA